MEREKKAQVGNRGAFCARYLADTEAGRLLVRGGRPKRPLILGSITLVSDRGRIEGHIVPLLGRMAVKSVTRRDVERLMHAVAAGASARTRKGKPRGILNIRGGRSVATRTVGLLGAIFTYAVQHGLRDDNPAHGIRKFAENKRERRLTEAEYGDLGRALRAAEGLSAPLAGYRPRTPRCRAGGDQNRAERGQLSRPVCNLLASLPRLGDGPLVFPVTRGTRLMAGFKGFARRILDLMGETIPSGEVVPLRA
ncbi:MAG: hypothetical protein K6U10_02420 [Acidobacteriia bacterium]|nr:hypothetical protein [Methyloceanibacter sp.]MCL6490656.1 hypothetical protein [Terriglobia bacterium]